MAARPRKPYSFHVRRRGPSWVGFYRLFDGDRSVIKQRVIGSRKDFTKTEAEEIHASWVREHVPAFGAIPERPTLLQLWERLIANERLRQERGKLEISTVRAHVSLAKHLQPLMDKRAKGIKGEDIEDLFDAVKLSPKSKKHLRQLLREILRPVGAGAVDDAKMRFETAPKGSTLEAEAILGILKQLPTDHDRLIFQLCLVTGLRASELSRLRAEHLREAGYMHVPGKKTALSKSRIPLIPEVGVPLAQLVEARGSMQLLFTQKTHRQWLENVLQPAGKRAGVAHVDMLALRRTAATKGAAIDEGATAKLMRHTTTRMVREVYDSAADDAVVEVQKAVWAGITNNKAN